MKNNKCPLCYSEKISKVRGSKVRDNNKLKVLECENCGLQFLDSFDHIDDKFYSESKMISTDEGTDLKTHLKENKIDNKRRSKYLKNKIINKRVLDFGCGNGGFLNEIKNYCKDCSGVEKDINHYNKFKRNKSIKIYSDISEVKTKFDYITIFHVLEHLKNPIKMLKDLSEKLKKNGRIIIEIPNSNDALLSHYKCKEFLKFNYISQHLFIFNEKSLKLLIKKANLKLVNIEQIQRYNLQNHMQWTYKGIGGGHLVKMDMSNKRLNNINKWYEDGLRKKGICDTLLLEISK